MKNTTSEEDGKRTSFIAILITIIVVTALFLPMPPEEVPVLDEPIQVPHLIEEAEAATEEPKEVRIVTVNHVVEADEMVVEKTVDIPEELKVICSCESAGHQHKDKNGVLLAGFVDSDDKGECQINTRYHGETMEKMGLDIQNDNDYYTYAVHLYKTQGRQPWSASASCWAPIIGYQ